MYILLNNKRHEIDVFTFNGGEEHVKLPKSSGKLFSVRLYSYIRNSSDLMRTLLAIDAMKRTYESASYELVMPYVPYARQDRVCNEGEAFSLKMFAEMINSFNLNKVFICDPHSDVTTALIKNVVVATQAKSFETYCNYSKLWTFINGCTIVSPDAGSNKKIVDVCKVAEKSSFVRADKIRDVQTGKILETVVFADELSGIYLIIDDICDGGATFTALAQELKKKGAHKVALYVTHGIFSKGKQHLLDNGIDYIYASYDWTTIGKQNA